ncbi:MAG: DNA recombination protein RmuC [Alphaproteobacteria bacterium]|nr:DNA recombination protein RmuC [Alphaproteobacteria bacterium]
MTGTELILAALLALVVLAAGLLLMRRGGGVELDAAIAERDRRQAEVSEKLAASQEQLAGRLAQIAESQAAAQARMAEALQAQEREIAKKLEERLADVTKRIGEGLEKSSKSTETTMGDLKERLAVIDRAQKNITELSTQVDGLQAILSNKQARGAFGEIQLNDLVTQALPPSAYSFQATVGGNRRVDCLLTLPNPPGDIAIDAKFPLEAYHLLQAAASDEERLAARRRLSQEVGVHVRAIAEKYIVPGETAESALMFLPSEAVYAELHANLPGVVQDAFRRRVWIVSPTTLMATLNTVRAVLKDASMREQAHVIQAEVGRLLDDVTRLDDRVSKLDRHFAQATDDIRQIRISTDKVTKRSERIQEIELEQPSAITDAAPTPPRLAAVED